MDPETAPANPLLAGLLTVVQEGHQDMTALVRGLPIDALKFMPSEDTPHLAGLVLHILEVEDYLAAVAAGQDIRWTSPLGSSLALVVPEPELVARIGATDARLTRAIAGATPELLGQPEPGGERSIGEMLVEDLAHSSLHLGHMQLTRQLMAETLKGLQLPEYVHWA